MNTFSKQPRTCRIVYIQFKFCTLLFENTGNFNQRVLLELHIPPARFQLTYGTLHGTACRHVSSLVLSFPGFQGVEGLALQRRHQGGSQCVPVNAMCSRSKGK